MRRKLRVFAPIVGIIKLLSLIGVCIVELIRSFGYAYLVLPVLLVVPWICICIFSFFGNDLDFLFFCLIFVCIFVVILVSILLQLMIHYFIHYIYDDIDDF